MNMSSPVASHFEMEKMQENECLFANSLIVFSYHLAYTISTQLGGFVIEKYSFQATFVVAAVFYLVSAGLYLWFFREERQQKSIIETTSHQKAA